MRYRPPDWAPLAAADPLPGDPYEIWDEAARLRSMAAELQDQVARLRQINTAQDLAGDWTEELRASAEEVAKKLELVHERYSTVANHLNQWAGELDDFQRVTLQALDKALDAERMAQRDPHVDLPVHNWSSYRAPMGAVLQPTNDAASALLAEARRDLERVLDEAAARDRHWGRLISDAIDDKLTDHWRDHLHHWVERNHGWLKNLSTGLGWATTLAAFGGLAFPPLTFVAMGLATTNLVIHGTEVVGGEKGALFEVGMDVLALASLGAGKWISKGFEESFGSTQQLAAKAASREAADAVRQEASAVREAMDQVLQDANASGATRRAAMRSWEQVQQRALKAGNDAAAEVMRMPSEPVGAWRIVSFGSKDDAQLYQNTSGLMAKFSEDAAVQSGRAKLELLRVAGNTNVAAQVADVADKTASLPFSPYRESYSKFKEGFALSGGLFH